MQSWRNGELKNPFSGKPLEFDSAHSVCDGDERFPVVANIPFLRAKRDDLKNRVLRLLDANDEKTALTLLLQDQDDWAKTPPPTAEDLQPLFENQDLTLRDAMRHLKYGAVADYFAYRWSDPTFLSGLALLEWHLPTRAKTVFELCCGIGHYLREFDLRGIEATGADVVFSKLWLARKFVAPNAKLVCVDANFALPFANKIFDAAFCHDAFYFLPEKQLVANELNRITNGAILIGHAHNSDADNFSSGAAISINEYAEIVKTANGSERTNENAKSNDDANGANFFLYDDAELTRSVIENRKPNAQTVGDLKQAEAIAIAQNAHYVNGWHVNFLVPLAERKLRLNPLLWDELANSIRQTPVFPSERYEKEYAPLSSYLNLGGKTITENNLKRAETEGWSHRAKLLDFTRRRIFLDLPEKW